MSPVNGEAGPIFMIMVACLGALEAIMKYQVEQLHKIATLFIFFRALFSTLRPN